MSHTLIGKEKLLNRVRRLRGQVNGVEKALECVGIGLDEDGELRDAEWCRGEVVEDVEFDCREHGLGAAKGFYQKQDWFGVGE